MIFLAFLVFKINDLINLLVFVLATLILWVNFKGGFCKFQLLQNMKAGKFRGAEGLQGNTVIALGYGH